jgi:hypothetical protein
LISLHQNRLRDLSERGALLRRALMPPAAPQLPSEDEPSCSMLALSAFRFRHFPLSHNAIHNAPFYNNGKIRIRDRRGLL